MFLFYLLLSSFPHYLFHFHPTNPLLRLPEVTSQLLAIMLAQHYMPITTSRSFAYANALAHLGWPPSSHVLSMSRPLFEALRLKFHLPFDTFYSSSYHLFLL